MVIDKLNFPSLARDTKITGFYLLALLCLTSIFNYPSQKALAQSTKNSNVVSVFLIRSGETKKISLRRNQTAQLTVYLATQGEQVDKYMISLIKLGDNNIVASSVSNLAGEVTFRNVTPGEYTIYLNPKVTDEYENSSITVADVKLKAYP